MPVDRLLSASKTSPAETRSNNSGRYTLLKSHIPSAQLKERWSHQHNQSAYFPESEKAPKCTGGTKTGLKHFPVALLIQR